MGRLAGKVAYVLGAAGRGNMGQVIARRFAEEGATVAVGGRHPEELEWLAGEIGGMAVTCDITKMEDIKSRSVPLWMLMARSILRQCHWPRPAGAV